MKRKGDARSKNKNGKSYNGKLLLDTNNHIILINCSLTLAPFRYHFQHLPFRINIKSFSFSVRLVRLRSFHLHSVQFDTVLVFFNVYAQWTFHLLGKFVFFLSCFISFCFCLVAHSTRKSLWRWCHFFLFLFFSVWIVLVMRPQLSSSLRIPFTIVITLGSMYYFCIFLDERHRIKSSQMYTNMIERNRVERW